MREHEIFPEVEGRSAILVKSAGAYGWYVLAWSDEMGMWFEKAQRSTQVEAITEAKRLARRAGVSWRLV